MRTVYTWKYNHVSDQLKKEGGGEQKKNYHRRRRGRDSLAILAIRHGQKLQNTLVGILLLVGRDSLAILAKSH
jgi:hypothetical protein